MFADVDLANEAVLPLVLASEVEAHESVPVVVVLGVDSRLQDLPEDAFVESNGKLTTVLANREFFGVGGLDEETHRRLPKV